MDKPKQYLPKLTSMPPMHPLSPRISLILQQTSLNINDKEVIDLSDIIQRDLIRGYELLTSIDEPIGGVGLNNVNKQVGDILTGAYRGQFRPLFRPIQYIYSSLGQDDLIWNAREIVLKSCLHVEKAYKYRCNIPEGNRDSLGVLIRNNPHAKSIGVSLLETIKNLNRTIYGNSKHTIEHLDIDAHDFSPADAIAIYLICRWIGVKLLEPTGVFSHWQDK